MRERGSAPDEGYTGAHADVAQLARASACHAEGRGFESHHPLSESSLSSLLLLLDLLHPSSSAGSVQGGAGMACLRGLRRRVYSSRPAEEHHEGPGCLVKPSRPSRTCC